MRALRTIIVVLLVSLGFLGGYFAGWYLHGENTVRLSPDAADVGQGGRQAAAAHHRGAAGPLLQAGRTSTSSPRPASTACSSRSTTPTPCTSRPRRCRTSRRRSSGSYSGIGASLQKTKDGLVITRCSTGRRPKAAGLTPGDIIVTRRRQAHQGRAPSRRASAASRATRARTVDARRPAQGQEAAAPRTSRSCARPSRSPRRASAIINDKGTKVGYVQLYEFGGLAGRDVREDVDDARPRRAPSGSSSTCATTAAACSRRPST